MQACLRRNHGQRIRCRGLPALQLRQSGLRERRVCQPKRKRRAQQPNQVLQGGIFRSFSCPYGSGCGHKPMLPDCQYLYTCSTLSATAPRAESQSWGQTCPDMTEGGAERRSSRQAQRSSSLYSRDATSTPCRKSASTCRPLTRRHTGATVGRQPAFADLIQTENC